MRRLLIANRGEIAVRIARAAMDLGIHTVAVYSEDDANGLHLRIADEAVALNGRGVPAYLDIEGVVGRAVDANCDAIHPGYGFLAENAAFAGGGGRGTRIVASAGEIDQAYERCRSEAERAFGNGGLYVEELIPRARHIEVQLLGDEEGGLIDLGERECSAQRRSRRAAPRAGATTTNRIACSSSPTATGCRSFSVEGGWNGGWAA